MTTDLHHLAAAYALDALDADERRSFESHYPTCEVCNAEVHEYRETAGRLAGGTATAPSAGLRDRVPDEVSRTRQIAPQVPDRVADLAEHRRRKSDLPWGSALLGAAAAIIVALIGFVAFDSGADGRSDPGDDRTYALWALDEAGAATPSLLFRPDDNGATSLVGGLDTEPAGWGVTIEPAGGSPAPTGDILYLTA